MHGHDGGIDGFISSYRYSTSANVGVIALVNSDQSGAALENVQRLLVLYALGDSTRRTPAEVKVSPATLARYAGYYRDMAPRNELFALLNRLFGGTTVSVRGDSLFTKGLSDSAIRLVAVDDSTFRRPNDAGPTVGFYHDHDGGLVMTGTTYLRRANPWPSRLLLAGLIAALVLGASAVLAALYWGIRAVFGKTRNVPANKLRATVLVAALSVPALVALVMTADFQYLGIVTPRTIGIFVFSLLVPLLALFALGSAWRAPRATVGTAVKVHSMLVALAVVGVALLLIVNGLAGLRTWAY